jgi:hypothetical protein
VADEVETMAEKHGLAPTLALMNTARIEIVRVLNENPQGLTEHEVTDSLGTTQMAYSLKLHLEALLAAEAIRFDGGRYYSMVDEETLRRMEDAKDRDYDRDAVQRH